MQFELPPSRLGETGSRLAALPRQPCHTAGLEQEPRLSPKAGFFVFLRRATKERKLKFIVAGLCKADLPNNNIEGRLDDALAESFPASDSPFFVGAGAKREEESMSLTKNSGGQYCRLIPVNRRCFYSRFYFRRRGHRASGRTVPLPFIGGARERKLKPSTSAQNSLQ